MIKSIAIKNYRGIKDLEINNFKKYNFFIGDNGSKKTTILESLGIAYLLDFFQILEYSIDRKIKLKKENISSLFYNSDINNNIEFILKTDDTPELETIISVDSNLSIFQDYSSNQVNKYLYTVDKKIGEDRLENNNIYLDKNNQIPYLENTIKNIPRNFEKFLKKYSILTQISNNINNLNDSTEEIDKIIKNRKKEKLL